MPRTDPNANASARVEETTYDSARDAFDALLALSDDSPTNLARCIADGTFFALRRGAVTLGVVVVTFEAPDTAEFEQVAVQEASHGRGLGTFLVTSVIDALRARGVRVIRLATATADVRVLRFYQRLGFRFVGIDRDWFTPARGYPADVVIDGVPLLDRARLEYAP